MWKYDAFNKKKNHIKSTLERKTEMRNSKIKLNVPPDVGGKWCFRFDPLTFGLCVICVVDLCIVNNTHMEI